MNEVFWFNGNDVPGMAQYITNRASQRKLRLLACAIVRRCYWDRLPFQAKQVVRAAENYADDPNGLAVMNTIAASFRASAFGGDQDDEDYYVDYEYINYDEESPEQRAVRLAQTCSLPEALYAARGVIFPVGVTHDAKETSHLMWELFGNPFSPAVIEPGCRSANDHAVVRLAHTIYTSDSYQLIPLLADALEEAGCQDEAILEHLRDASCQHVRGCWVLDLILGDRPILATPFEDFLQMDSDPVPELLVPRGAWVLRVQSHCSPKNHPFEDDYPQNALNILSQEFPEVAFAEHVDQRELCNHPYVLDGRHYWYIAEQHGLPYPKRHHAARTESNANGWTLLYDDRHTAMQDLATIYPPLGHLEEVRSLNRQELLSLVNQAEAGDSLVIRSIAGVLEVSGVDDDLATRVREFAGGRPWTQRNVECLQRDVERESFASQYQVVKCPQCGVKGVEVIRSDELGETNTQLQVLCTICEWTEPLKTES